MTKKEFTPEQQLKRIEEMVFEARIRFEDNGFAYILWGAVIAVASFSELKQVTKASAGNLSVQIKKLETEGYFSVEKSFKNNYPHTQLEITPAGEKAFKDYLKALKSYF